MDSQDFNEGRLECTVTKPQKENDGTKDAYVSYLVSTQVSTHPQPGSTTASCARTDFKSFQRPEFSVRRRFTDFVFLFKTLSREYPQCAVPPLPDKHKMEYVRGDRFGPDFTQRRAHSLHRFLKRLTLHPVLRRAALLILFLESPDWHQTMRSRPSRGSSLSDSGGGASSGVFDNFTDTFLNAFSKVHKPDRRFIEVRERADKLEEDLGHVEKIVARVARRQADLDADYGDLATQFQKLVALESGVDAPLTSFAVSVDTTSKGWKGLRDATDQNYLTSLRDMGAYILALRALLKTREQKQLDFEGLTDYLNKAAQDRDSLASQHGYGGAGLGASAFLRSKIEDVRGVDHEQSRRERVRKLELQIERLTREVDDAKTTMEAFDEQVVKEVADFERIKAVEFRDTLGDLADAHVDFYKSTIDTWERFLQDMEKERAAEESG
ncbi:putative sorting nexin-4 [Lineolata rhizophorae]|uniref:Sorting nexin-4 n=1 Tax=Lineolata rhizophorae TaxID=578093 RepID=A0A6A6P7S5_9PEZI|nr:putative sorting nexin-4 [Lineolata rhizophorae]